MLLPTHEIPENENAELGLLLMVKTIDVSS
jgi:hypothetical protein